MSAQDLWLDGNAIAGLLAELFGTEMTTVDRGCSSCGAGLVLRCPTCDDVAMQVAMLVGRRVLTLRGTWSVAIPG